MREKLHSREPCNLVEAEHKECPHRGQAPSQDLDGQSKCPVAQLLVWTGLGSEQ